MMLTEQSAVSGAILPVQAMKDHLRLGTGFADDGLQDALIEAHVRAAMAVIEARTGKCLLQRRFLLRLAAWRDHGAGQSLPLAPIVAIHGVTLVDATGAETPVAPERYRLVPDAARPVLAGLGGGLPQIPALGEARVEFDAGFGAGWSAVPPDLAQAVMLLAAEFYERRHEGGERVPGLPMTVQALIDPWRTVRVLRGVSL